MDNIFGIPAEELLADGKTPVEKLEDYLGQKSFQSVEEWEDRWFFDPSTPSQDDAIRQFHYALSTWKDYYVGAKAASMFYTCFALVVCGIAFSLKAWLIGISVIYPLPMVWCYVHIYLRYLKKSIEYRSAAEIYNANLQTSFNCYPFMDSEKAAAELRIWRTDYWCELSVKRMAKEDELSFQKLQKTQKYLLVLLLIIVAAPYADYLCDGVLLNADSSLRVFSLLFSIMWNILYTILLVWDSSRKSTWEHILKPGVIVGLLIFFQFSYPLARLLVTWLYY